MPRRPSQLLPLLACLGVIAALGGCGASKKPLLDENNTGAGGVNSNYISLGDLRYQVQVSRALNPSDIEDQPYLTGVPGAQSQPPAGQQWFGVFVLVLNKSKRTAMPASTFQLSDTQGDTFNPLPPAASNVFAYRPINIPPGGQVPAQDSVASAGPTQASLLLFKLPTTAYENRPLILTIVNPDDLRQRGTVTLDV